MDTGSKQCILNSTVNYLFTIKSTENIALYSFQKQNPIIVYDQGLDNKNILQIF